MGELGQAERIRSGCTYRDAEAQNSLSKCKQTENNNNDTPSKNKKKVFIFRNGGEAIFF